MQNMYLVATYKISSKYPTWLTPLVKVDFQQLPSPRLRLQIVANYVGGKFCSVFQPLL